MNVLEKVINHSIAREFTRTPGPRFQSEGPWSGEAFRTEQLEPWFKEAQLQGSKLFVDLDGGYGYAPSFLEEAFGGLARLYGSAKVLSGLELKSDEEPYLKDRVQKYISEANG
jgi:hypothetical protein